MRHRAVEAAPPGLRLSPLPARRPWWSSRRGARGRRRRPGASRHGGRRVSRASHSHGVPLRPRSCARRRRQQSRRRMRRRKVLPGPSVLTFRVSFVAFALRPPAIGADRGMLLSGRRAEQSVKFNFVNHICGVYEDLFKASWALFVVNVPYWHVAPLARCQPRRIARAGGEFGGKAVFRAHGLACRGGFAWL